MVALFTARSPEREVIVPEKALSVFQRVTMFPESVEREDCIPTTTPERAF